MYCTVDTASDSVQDDHKNSAKAYRVRRMRLHTHADLRAEAQ